jgi:hypothetical protein
MGNGFLHESGGFAVIRWHWGEGELIPEIGKRRVFLKLLRGGRDTLLHGEGELIPGIGWRCV